MKSKKSLVHQSKMSGKLEGLRAISTNTVSNPFCIKMNTAKKSTICSFCYSHNMLNTFRKNAQPALQRNSDLLSSRVLEVDELPVIKDKYYRFQAHGELVNETHFVNLINIAKHNPKTNFGFWTKRRDIVNRWVRRGGRVPDNVILIYSNPRIDKPLDFPPTNFHKTFNNVSADKFVAEQNCFGKCRDCMVCYKRDTVNTIIEAVK